MTGSENRGEKQPGRVPLQTGPGRDAIAKSVILCRFPAGLIQGNSWRQHTGSYPRSQCNEAKTFGTTFGWAVQRRWTRECFRRSQSLNTTPWPEGRLMRRPILFPTSAWYPRACGWRLLRSTRGTVTPRLTTVSGLSEVAVAQVLERMVGDTGIEPVASSV
jgi:hypothetical protein